MEGKETMSWAGSGQQARKVDGAEQREAEGGKGRPAGRRGYEGGVGLEGAIGPIRSW